MNQIWLGPLLGNNRNSLIERCTALVASNQGDSFLYLAASHPLLDLVSQKILDGDNTHGLWGELPVYLFRGFVRRILTTAISEDGKSLPPRLPIDREELPLRRSLVSQILTRLEQAGKLKAIGPLARREGCVNTMTALIGEIERAAKTPVEVAEIIAVRAQDLVPRTATGPATQLDFDREVSLVYSTYCALLEQHQLTEVDADQMRALSVLKDNVDGPASRLPWLRNVRLLVLDGFFDFTPVQGEILRHLIPAIPEVVVNLNHDSRNPDIFLPFQETIGQLSAIALFETKHTTEQQSVSGALGGLRQSLFNPSIANRSDDQPGLDQSEIRYLECGDRDTEIRTVAREIKRLIRREQYDLSDIALVVRQRASYAETIARVMREEGLPCNLELRVVANDVPATRAAIKLLSILEEISVEGLAGAQPGRRSVPVPRVSELADLIKSEYFRLSDDHLGRLSSAFDLEFGELLREGDEPLDATTEERLKNRYRIGFWDADALENAFAYVGSELPVGAWLERARKLIRDLPGATATRELLNLDSGAQDRDPDLGDQIENAETAKVEEKDAEKKRRPSRDIHPATIAWTALVVQGLAERLLTVPREGRPVDLRLELMRLLEDLGFRDQIVKPTRDFANEQELPQVMLNFNALESLRRAFLAAIKSIEITGEVGVRDQNDELTKMPDFIDEVRRALASQSQNFGTPERGGLRVLEATDVRGLRFRAVFIAGMVEGGFPLRASRDWIYPHEERERLKRYGLTLEDISPATLLKEEHYFYQAACRATERLYLSRPLLLEDDSETVVSYYLDELRRAIAPFKLEPETIRRDYEGRNLATASNTTELKVALVRQQERHLHRGQHGNLLPQPRIKRLLTLARNDGFVSDAALRRIEIERERSSQSFGPYDGEITDPHLLVLLRQKFGADFVHSASGLSVYGNCPYRFFAQRVLKLEPRGEAALDLQAIDAGKLLHDILRRFFENHRRQPLFEVELAQLRKELASIADAVFDEHERVVPPLNQQIWKIDREIRKILLDQVLLYELEMQREAAAEGVVPAYFEVAFGGTKSAARDPHSKEQPLQLTRATFVGEETMKISGQIDRVDLARDNTLVAYDYKLSVGSTKEDVRAGRSLQIPIYLEALERLILPGHPVSGGGYYVIRGGKERRNKGLHRASMNRYSNIGTRTDAVMGDYEWRQIRDDVIVKIWDFLDRMRAGKFFVNPSERETTCRFCDFNAVCRYQRYRIERKKK